MLFKISYFDKTRQNANFWRNPLSSKPRTIQTQITYLLLVGCFQKHVCTRLTSLNQQPQNYDFEEEDSLKNWHFVSFRLIKVFCLTFCVFLIILCLSASLCSFQQGQHDSVWHKCLFRHEPTFLYSSLGRGCGSVACSWGRHAADVGSAPTTSIVTSQCIKCVNY